MFEHLKRPPMCVAVIPARGGSKGIPRKNVLPMGGVPLVARAVLAARAASRVDAVYVSTDDPEIAHIAESYGARVVIRPAGISGDEASSEAALLHALAAMKKTDGFEPEVLVMLQCTSPFTIGAEIDQAVAALDDPRFAAALSVVEDHGFVWAIDGGGNGIGVNHDHTRPRRRRQELPPQFRENGAIYAMRVADFQRTGTRFCGAVRLVPLDQPALEIDSHADWSVAESILAACAPSRKRNAPPPPAIKALVTDFDGVHTDDCVCIGQDGRETVKCSRADGMGFERLRAVGFETLILSKENNPVVAARAAKLCSPVIHACEDKKYALTAWLAERGWMARDVAYMGNDINDLKCLALAGWSCCPADAHPAVLASAAYVARAAGGRGAVREIAELLLATRKMHGLEESDAAT